jgi:hypothetical protein
MSEPQYCTKVIYDSGGNKPTIILGIIENETEDFLTIRTAKNTTTINKKRIISTQTTNQKYQQGGN